jgi:mono/diheme cytochrome c family protein
MKIRLLATTVGAAALAAGLLVGTQAVVAAPTATPVIATPERADNFQLTDHRRMHHELAYYDYAPAIVLMSQTNGSKVSRAAAAELEKLADAYADKGVLVFLLNSSLGATREQVAKEMAALGVDLPVLMDEHQLVGESLGVTRDGEVFVIEPKTRTVAYHGPLDDRFAKASPSTKAKAKSPYAADAVAALLAGRKVEKARVEIKAGSRIAFPEREAAKQHASISYADTIAPIIEEKCASCHVDGGIAPFAMNSYEVVKGYAPMIRESIRTDRMPPYFADPHIGQFKNDQALTPKQVKTLVHWIEAGAPRGDGPDPLKTNVTRAPEWPAALGKPDVVVTLPPFQVPASGVIEYQYPTVDNPFKGDAWLRAMVVVPGDRSVVHHVTSGHVSAKDSLSELPGGSVGSYTPGAEPQIIAADAGAPVPAGGKLRYSMHYTTTGKPATDVTRIGYYLHDKKPKYIKRSAVIGDSTIEIPPGEQRYTMYSYLEFPADAYLYTLYPHAHYRGAHVELTAVKPDGSRELLLSLPKYDFNWQRDYDPVKPIHVKAGTKLQAKWVYDNSVHNHANPDPKATVLNGDQSWEEMMYFRVNYRWADETSDNIRNDLQAKLMATRNIGQLDDNLDGVVQKSELTGSMKKHQARFEEIDLDRSGALDEAEMTKGGVIRSRSQAEEQGVE